MEEINYSDKNRRLVPTRFKRMFLVVFAFVLHYLVSYILDPYSAYWQDYFTRSISEIIAEWAVSFLFCFLISEVSIFIHRKLNLRVPWTQNKSKRLFLEITLNFIAVLTLILMNMLCYAIIDPQSAQIESVPSMEEIKDILQWIVVSLVISFMIISINTMSYLINNWIETATEMSEHKIKAAELKQASVEAELNALKMQLDPHFIFNNLSVLSELILEDQQLGFEYSENFAKVYRFLLVNSKKNMITLDEEIRFLNAYIFLIEHRVGSGVNFTIDIDDHSRNMYIPSLTLQLLIENAIKHNSTNKRRPLMIRISNEEVGKVVIENTLSPLDHSEITSTGIGLNNITSRFQLLGEQVPEVTRDQHTFRVSIQLVTYDIEHA